MIKIQLEKLKKEHPEHFKNEINEEIEKEKKKQENNKTPQEITNDLLVRLNENIEKMNSLKENVNKENKE